MTSAKLQLCLHKHKWSCINNVLATTVPKLNHICSKQVKVSDSDYSDDGTRCSATPNNWNKNSSSFFKKNWVYSFHWWKEEEEQQQQNKNPLESTAVFFKRFKKKRIFSFFFFKKSTFWAIKWGTERGSKKQDKDRSTLTILNFITILEAVVEAKMKTHSKLCILHHASHLCWFII